MLAKCVLLGCHQRWQFTHLCLVNVDRPCTEKDAAIGDISSRLVEYDCKDINMCNINPVQDKPRKV